MRLNITADTSQPVHPYSYELCDTFAPRDVLDALGEPPQVCQVRAVVFARRAKDARTRLACLGFRTPAANPRRATGRDITALMSEGSGADSDDAWVISKDGQVGCVYWNGRYRETAIIGVITLGGLVCGPVQDPKGAVMADLAAKVRDPQIRRTANG